MSHARRPAEADNPRRPAQPIPLSWPKRNPPATNRRTIPTATTATAPSRRPTTWNPPREESITQSDPHSALEEDNDAFNEFSYPGETLDLTRAHEMGSEDFGTEPANRALMAGAAALTGQTPVKPVAWYSATAVLGLLMWGGMYLGTYSGGFQGDVYNETAQLQDERGSAGRSQGPQGHARRRSEAVHGELRPVPPGERPGPSRVSSRRWWPPSGSWATRPNG